MSNVTYVKMVKRPKGPQRYMCEPAFGKDVIVTPGQYKAITDAVAAKAVLEDTYRDASNNDHPYFEKVSEDEFLSATGAVKASGEEGGGEEKVERAPTPRSGARRVARNA